VFLGSRFARFLAAAAKPFTALRLCAFGAYEDGGSKQQEYDECRKRVIRALLQINYLDCSGI